jgi:hypothetical protein
MEGALDVLPDIPMKEQQVEELKATGTDDITDPRLRAQLGGANAKHDKYRQQAARTEQNFQNPQKRREPLKVP